MTLKAAPKTLTARADGALNARAYSEIKRAIITHRLKPGERISEGILAKGFDFGRAPIRAAITRLIEEGLIVARGAKTQIIAPLTFADIHEIFMLRAVLETEAARRAAGQADIAELRRLNALCLKQYRFGEAAEELAFLEANRTFHMAIGAAARSPRLERWIGQLQDAAMRILWIALKVDNRPEAWSHGHDDIIAAIEAGNGAEAASWAKKHLLDGEQAILDVVMSAANMRELSLSSVTSR